MVEASGFIWETNGQAVNTAPTAAAAPVATSENRPRERAKYATGMGCRRPRSPRRQMEHFFDRTGQKSLSRIVLLAPLPDERKPAIGRERCNARKPRRSLFYSCISGGT